MSALEEPRVACRLDHRHSLRTSPTRRAGGIGSSHVSLWGIDGGMTPSSPDAQYVRRGESG
jgi:hypothetical protein